MNDNTIEYPAGIQEMWKWKAVPQCLHWFTLQVATIARTELRITQVIIGLFGKLWIVIRLYQGL